MCPFCYWRAVSETSALGGVVQLKRVCLAVYPIFAARERRPGMNRIVHSDWVKLSVELNCAPNQNTKFPFYYRLVVPFQQLLEGPMEVLLCERVNEFRHSLFHLLNCLITAAFGWEIIKIGQSSHDMYSNSILNFQESMTILNACTKKSENSLNVPRISKVFDSIHREKMEQIFHAYDLPKETITSIMMLYKNTKTTVYTPDCETDFVDKDAGSWEMATQSQIFNS